MQTQCALQIAAERHQRVKRGIAYRRHLQAITARSKVGKPERAVVRGLQTRQEALAGIQPKGDKPQSIALPGIHHFALKAEALRVVGSR